MISAQVGIVLNSIEMMESGRCGRRKQRNPKRKNVENGVDGDEPEEVTLDDNKNQIISTHSPSGSSYHSDNDDADMCHDRDTPSPVTAKKAEPSPEEKVTAILREIQQQQQQQQQQKLQLATPDSTSDGDKVPLQQTVAGDGRQRGKQTEDAQIAELLNRGDTAVIYPEPVSDGEETHNEDGGLSEEEIVLKCMHCPQTFLRAIVLRDHMREVHADKPLKFMCPKCDETFHQKSQLDKHLTLHSPTSQICTVCNKTFANVYRLQRHMISHNESTDLRKFKCPECGKAFKFKHHLKEHVRIHSGEKPFICNNCGKRFSHSGSFSSHTTSKKCWGLSAHKARVGGQDGLQNLGQTISQAVTQSLGSFVQKMPVSFASTKMTQFSRSSVPVTLAHQHQQHFMPNPYSQQKGMPPFYYPPQMFASPDGFLHPIYSVAQSLPTHHLPHGLALPGFTGMKQSQSDQDSGKDHLSESPHPSMSSGSSMSRSTRSLSPHSQSTRSFSPHSHSGRSVSPYSAYAFSLSSPPPSHSRGRSTTPGSQSYRDMTPVSERATPISERATSSVERAPSTNERATPVRERAPSHSPHQHLEQISPDVNSNTKLLLFKEEPVPEPMSTTSDEPAKTISEHSEAKSTELKVPDVQVKTETLNQDNEAVNDQSVTSQSESDKTTKRAMPCHYCGEVFESPVAKHQHERYMCKHNKDLIQNRTQIEACQSPHSTVSDISHLETTPNGSVGNDTDEEEVEELYKDNDITFDEKKMRIRSLFTEEQQNFLKAQYISNPRPRKFELIRMGNKIGFPKRVVQVWFQNMRARERKQGREFAFSLATVKTENLDREWSKSPTYIPNVPKLPSMIGLSSKVPVHQPSPPSQYKIGPGELPLDLSVRKTPPLAHGGSVSSLSTSDISHDDQVLNLSVKKDSSVERESSVENQMNRNHEKDSASQMTQKRFLQDSAIFKYMQQEGMILNKRLPHLTGTMSPSLAHTLQTQLFHQSMASILKMPAYPSSATLDTNNSSGSLLFDAANNGSDNSKLDSGSCSRLVIDEAIKEANSHSRDSTPPYSRATTQSHMTSDSDTSNQSHLKRMSHDALPEDTHNLATLAEAAQRAANIMSGKQRAANMVGKPKRLRKKTWRQMESEEVQLDFEDSMSTDEDQPLKKKRKSWKNHRVDREEGLYACDQCNKVFSKQSSLARHKYEHSGARPFACDMCTKSFKHKHHLTEHKRLHSGEKPFQCKKCGKRFSHSGSFSQHMNHRYNYCSPHKTSDGDGDLSSQESPESP